MDTNFADFSRSIEPFLYNILSNPEYKPDTTDYLQVAYDIYAFTTLIPQNSYSPDEQDENPYNNQFERVFNILLDFSNNHIKSILTENNNLMNHLHTVKQRIKIINHAFRYLNKKRVFFINNANQCKFGAQISFSFFKKFLDQNENNDKKEEKQYDDLVKQSIEKIDPLFSGTPQDADFSYLTNLNFICLYASKAVDSNNINHLYEIYGHQKIIDALNAKLKQCLNKVDKNSLPKIVDNFYEFIIKIKNQETKQLIYTNLYEIIIRKFIDECNREITSFPALQIIENKDKYIDQIQLVRVLSFHDLTLRYVEEFFLKFLEEFGQKIVQETKVKDLSKDLLNFLDYIRFFNQITYVNKCIIGKDPFNIYMINQTKEKFKQLKFNKKFGDKFSIVLSYVFDHFMKKGDNLSNKQVAMFDIKKMLELLTYVTDRDTFILHHTSYMFYRITTRSTKGLKNEKELLENVKAIVQNLTTLKNAFEIIEQAEQEEFESLNKQRFCYYIIRNQLAPDRKYPTFPLPKDYKEILNLAENRLSKREKGKKYEWIHYLTTVNVRLSKNNKFYLLTMSLGQFIIFTALSKHPDLSIKDLNEITNIEEDYIEVIIKSFKKAKFVAYKSTDESAANSLQNVKINLDNSFAPKQQINLCDNWDQQYVPQQKNLDTQRKKSVQAAIVQIMKQCKMLQTQQLIDMTISKVSGLYAATDEDVMSCIRELVADEYLEESEGGAQLSYIE